ncbi:MAG TPA: adenosylmethionine decarboxylase [Acidiphilium sp.]|nr:MAG: adenosylmethionine decarboxylase [Acidiphilium sp. 21-60-14]OYV91402.1 MAG: adenosylmethionine decarboxylase [Acidiphilium sp. 37-60-79]OZB41396.1 MAG: adenosylmethionine decarboxylase [Acidiphilium sp. 34-60-192]HQT87266.1 adenosylmethionine decarboxylase [Acidiphilium sp.]HQU23193.1 adenosylmethionine decarboxylase [Acidiphilium sp.]
MNALARLGMVSEIPSENQTMINTAVCSNGTGEDHAVPKDYFVERDGVRFAGTHLLIDIWGASRLDEPELIDETLRAGALAAGATILHSHFHHFTPNGGVSGVVVLAESHISIHTWPERGFAALDIFMCGDCNPYKAIPLIKAAFTPTDVQVGEQRRGLTS